jgi:tryptophan synthase alpha chain
MNRIDALFSRLRSEGRRALMPFVTAGDPDLPTTAALVTELVRQGGHIMELGIPYSDPIADGPVIAASYHRALQRGVKLPHIFETIRTLRAETVSGPLSVVPLVTMVSYAIVYRRGVDQYLQDALTAGIDGLIVPDLPIEESEELCRQTTARDLKLIQLITPTTPRDRATRIARVSTGFIYYVSVAGITGERKTIPPDLAENVGWLRTQTDLPICIGFGIGTPEQVQALAPLADGLIVGSSLVRRIGDAARLPRADLCNEIGRFVGTLAAALDTAAGPGAAPAVTRPLPGAAAQAS